MLTDEEVLAAVRRSVEERGGGVRVSPDEAVITRHLLLDGEILRCMETRTEEERFHRGAVDLSEWPEYDADLRGHRIPAPRDPADETTLKLVRRGSKDDRSCDCGNGRVACQRCKGDGDLRCSPRTTCGECRGLDCCLRCDGSGRRTRKARAGSDAEADEGRKAGRVACGQCGAKEAACAGCQGRGEVSCARCGGTGSRACPDCDRAGTVPHQRCGGKARTVTWTEGVVTRRPRVEEVKVPGSGLPYWARQQAREHGDWKHVHLVGEGVGLAGDVDEEVVKNVAPRLVVREGEISRRISLRHLSLARVTLAPHPHRVYFVIPAQEGPRVLVWPSRRRTWLIAAVALAALAVLVAVSRLIGLA
ncbi:hypothetical protein [Streptomyces wedmorensis]